ncbi:ribonuclease H family protein [Halobacillus mangrovi]|uniref:RNase H type-1 domain-containing protein n=1 Tax=Halobacillus mangrovi TaxID=402384 RepID=A0A1W5ZV52_9BACI|nr:ribonuclease H family protein [Halobacillus mangrovi]ARI77155.1 hypothetical protein HM131_10030 [Halobacillus mangrovi]
MNVRIQFTYLTKKGSTTTFLSEEMPAERALIIAEDIDKTDRSKDLYFPDPHGYSWTVKELKKYMKGIQTEPHNITVYFDGGYDHNSRESGLGCAIYYDQNGKSHRLRRNAFVEELFSNNEAEYAALHLAIKELEIMQVQHMPVTFVGDSQVVINQLSGEWPCLEEELTKWADRIEGKLNELGIEPEFQLVSRKRNKEADKLASQALKNIEITSLIEIENQ